MCDLVLHSKLLEQKKAKRFASHLNNFSTDFYVMYAVETCWSDESHCQNAKVI